jgi:hypothetical protein
MTIPKKLKPKPQRVCDECYPNKIINGDTIFALWKQSDKCMMKGCVKIFNWRIRKVNIFFNLLEEIGCRLF